MKKQRRAAPARSRREAPPRGSRRAGVAALLVALGLLAYVNALHNPFVYDDQRVVLGNPSLQDPLNWRFVLVYEPFRPVANVSYAVDHAVWGARPFGFHLTGLVLHLVNVLLLLRLVEHAVVDARARRGDELEAREAEQRATGRASPLAIAAVAAALFAVHPLASEAVGYTSARPELLAAAFFLGGLLAARRRILGGGLAWLAVYAACFVLGSLSKETGALLPAAVLLYDLLLVGGDPTLRRRRLLTLHLPFMLLLAAGGLWRLRAFATVEAATLARPWPAHVRTELVVLWRYLGLLAAPLRLSLVHPAQTIVRWLDPRVLASAIGLAAAVAAGVWARRRWPVVVFGAACFLLAVSPTCLVPLRELMSEHRVYLASAGALIVVAAAWGRWRRSPRFGGLAPAAALLAVGVLLYGTVQRNRVWSDPVTLWQDAVDKAPRTWAPRQGLALALRQSRGCAAAVPVYRQAAEILPEPSTLIDLGTCLAVMGRYPQAEQVLAEALRLSPRSADLLSNLGELARLTGRADLARQRLLAAIEAEPRHVNARLHLAALAQQQGRPDEALRWCREARELAPELDAARQCVARLERQEPSS